MDEPVVLELVGNHWGNSLYLEWHSARNGRVVIEATDYELTIEPEPAWIPPLREELQRIRQTVQTKIDEVREVLKREES